MAGNDADAADATQEALLAIVRGLPRFDRRSRFGTWCYRIAVNASLDELRRRRRRPEPAELDDGYGDGSAARRRAGPGAGGPGAGGPGSGPGGDPAAGVDERLDIDAALARLPGDFRAAVVLRDLCALDYAEIAEVLGIPPGTVRSRIARGRAALVPLLAPRPAGDESAPAGNPAPLPRRPTEAP